MGEVWSNREEAAIGHDLLGFDVEASDGHIGKIDEWSDDAGMSHVVVDTGHWIFGKKRLVPAGVISRIDRETRTVFLTMTKDQVKDAPDFDPGFLSDAVYKDRLSTFYGEHVV